MPLKPRKPKVKKGLTWDQTAHLVTGYAFDFFPFSSLEERKKLYFENKEMLFEICKDPERVKEECFYNWKKEKPHGFYDYEDPSGQKAYELSCISFNADLSRRGKE